jgi:chaperone modulatory protein CbpM
MDINNKVLLQQFCLHHEVELSFIDSLHEYGLITILVFNGDKYILADDLKEIEKMAHFYYELGINIEGIEVIINLLLQNDRLRKELNFARRKLLTYESSF